MQIENCEFPDDALFDADCLVWVREEASGDVLVGITNIQAALAGPLTRVAARPVGAAYERGKNLGTLEGGRYFGGIRTPIRGTLIAINEAVLRNPKVLSQDPYREGWFARLRPFAWAEDRTALAAASEAKERLQTQIQSLHIHCFAAFPDHELFEVGTECAAVLAKLDELMERAEPGDVVHLVSDDWTAPAEMVNWSERTGYPLLETRKEGTLHHFLVRKGP